MPILVPQKKRYNWFKVFVVNKYDKCYYHKQIEGQYNFEIGN